MKIVTENSPIIEAATIKLPPGIVRLYNKVDGSTVDVHAVDGKEYVRKLPHLWSYSPVAKEQAKAEDAVIVPEPVKEPIAEEKPAKSKVPVIAEEKPVSARSRKLAKFED